MKGCKKMLLMLLGPKFTPYFSIIGFITVSKSQITFSFSTNKIHTHTHQINNNIFAKLCSPFRCNLTDVQDSFRVISIHMEYWSIHNLVEGLNSKQNLFTAAVKGLHMRRAAYQAGTYRISGFNSMKHSPGGVFLLISGWDARLS